MNIHPRANIGYFATLASRERNIHARSEDKRKHQTEKIVKLVRYAAEKVPFYRELYAESGIDIDKIRELEDISKLPIIEKSQIRNAGLEAVSPEFDHTQLFTRNTSGSTGNILSIYSTWEDASRIGAGYDHAMMQVGYNILRDMLAMGVSPAATMSLRWYRKFILKRYYFFLHEGNVKSANRLLEINPDLIFMSPAVLQVLAKTIQEEGIPTPRNLRLIFTAGEKLYPKVRELVHETFGSDPYEIYGAWEAGMIGRQCEERTSFHQNWENIILEIIRDKEAVSPGESGEVVITNLSSKAMPFIRYRLGDIASIDEDGCSCGYSGMTIKKVEGRTNDFVTLEGGKTLAPDFISGGFRKFDWIDGYRILQHDYTSFEVVIVPKKGMETGLDEIPAFMRMLLGEEDIEVTVNLAESLPATPKNRTVISKVPCPISAV